MSRTRRKGKSAAASRSSRVVTWRGPKPSSPRRTESGSQRESRSHIQSSATATGKALEAGVADGPTEARPTQLDGVTPVRGVSTTGWFDVPSGNGNIIELVVVLSSFAADPTRAAVRVDRAVGNTRELIYFRSFEVPGGGARRLVVSSLENERIEITVHRTSAALHASAAVTQTFRADGAVVVMRYHSPADFVPV